MKIVTILVLSLMVAAIPALAGTQVLPHLAVGGGYESTVTLTNLMSDEAQYVYLQLYTDTGENWRVDSENGRSFRFNLTLEPRESVSLTLTGAPETVETGWGMVVDRGPVMVTATYHLSSGTVEAGSGVLPARPDVVTFLPVVIATADRVNTGLAVANMSGTAGDATIQLLDASGTVQATRTVHLAAMSRFVGLLTSETLFPEVDDLQGFLRIDADQPLDDLLGDEAEDAERKHEEQDEGAEASGLRLARQLEDDEEHERDERADAPGQAEFRDLGFGQAERRRLHRPLQTRGGSRSASSTSR